MNERPSTAPGAVKFLLVDDRPENLIALEALLKRDGLELVQAGSGQQALELLLQHEIALAILDVQMPQMNGFELAELMRGAERTRSIPIIFVTAEHSDKGRVFRGYDAGAVDFLQKPIDPWLVKSKAEVFFELARQKQQLLRANEELQESLRLNEMLVAVLGHDLRSPLQAILTGTELALLKASDENLQRHLLRTKSSGQRMSRMLVDLLDFVRARQGGGLPMKPKEVDLREVAQPIVAEQQVAHPHRQLVLREQGSLTGVWDPERLAQLLSNLLGNAVKHGAPDQPVEVELDGRQPGGVSLTVKNAGGLPTAILERLFEPFHGSKEHRGSSGGLGLGLYIVDQIARAHGASVSVDLPCDTETCFRVTLPRVAK